MGQFKLGKKGVTWQWGLLLLLAGLTVAGGCTRRFYRKQADNEVMAILHEKDKDPRWRIGMFNVYPDPRSRFSDREEWDRPPMPPDDPMAKLLSPNPQRPPHFKGVAYTEGWGYMRLLEQWDPENRVQEATLKNRIKHLDPYEGQDPKQRRMIGPAGPTPPVIDALTKYELKNELAQPVGRAGLLPPSEEQPTKKKAYLLTLEQAVELAQFNSRELQSARENLYLSALPVTLERFSFAAQGFALEQILREYAGPGNPGGPKNNWAFNTTGGFSKLFSTGALLLVQFANQTVVNLGSLASGSVRTVSQSNINLDIVQPFLRGGGRAVTLEPLTQAERDLLYSVRDYAKFRQGFYTFIAVGQAAFIVGQSAGVTALPLGTVTTPGTFVPGADPVTTGVVGPTGPIQVPPGSGGRVGVINPPGANPTGYLSTLAQKAQQVIARKNLNSYEYFYKLFQVFDQGGIVTPLQVGQIQQGLLGAIQQQLQQWIQYRQALDLFRIQLGLPATVNLELSDGPIQPMYDLITRYENSSTAYAMAVNEAGNHGKYEETDKVRQRLHDIFIKSPLTAGLTFQKEAPRGWAAWEKLKPAAIKAKLKELKAERNKLLDHKADLEVKGQELSESEKQRLEELGFDIDVGEFEPLLRDYEAQPWKALPDPKARLAKHAAKFADVLRGFAAILAPATKERQAQIRESWPPLFPAFVGEVDLLSADDDTALDTVVQTAFNNRLDLMNQRAQLVDSWRKLRVVANSLFGTFNVEYHLNSTTPPGRNAPFAFSENRTAHELIFNTQLPIVRRAERNNYRSALIAYQQQRRAWMDAQDQIAFAVRFQLRNLRSAAFNFQVVQRRNMELAYLVVDQALQAFNQPAAPTGGGGQVSPPGGAPSQGDAAALTQQLVQVQGTLVAAQNGLFNQWLGYIQNRISLYRDMGLMPLDERGLWIDDVTYYHPSGESGACLPGFLPTVVPEPGAHEPNAPLPPHEAPAQPVPPEQLPPPAQLLSPTILAPQQMP